MLVEVAHEEKWRGLVQNAPQVVDAGPLKIEIKRDPLAMTVRRADGTPVQELQFEGADGAFSFRMDTPVFGLGENGSRFDRRGWLGVVRSAAARHV